MTNYRLAYFLLNRFIKNYDKGKVKIYEENFLKTRNTVSNAHKMIPPATQRFVWQSPCFALGNPKIIQIKT